ncbi:hypothetical protein ACKWTF_014347 [Chironomus riparius]
MHLDGYKYWLAYKKGPKSYYRCSRSKSQKCPGKIIMENFKVITSIPHDHEKEVRNNAVERFRRVLTKKAIEKPNKPLVDIYLEETVNHSEASILYPFTQAESTMRKARSKDLDEKRKIEDEKKKVDQKSETEKIYEGNVSQIEEVGRKNEDKIQTTLTQIETKFIKMDKLETEMQNSESKYRRFEHQSKNFEGSLQNFDEKLQNIEKKLHNIQEKRDKIEGKAQGRAEKSPKPHQVNTSKTNNHQKYFYIENISEDTKIILMNQGTLSSLGKIEEIHIDCGMSVDVKDEINAAESKTAEKTDTNLPQNADQNMFNQCQELSNLSEMSFLQQNFAYSNPIPLESYENINLVYGNFEQGENSQMIQTIEFTACSSSDNYFSDTYQPSKDVNVTSGQYFTSKSDEHQVMSIDYETQKDPQQMNIDFGAADLQIQDFNVDFGGKSTADFAFGQSTEEIRKESEFVDQTQYYEEFLVSCSENSDNSSQNQFNVPQSSISDCQSSRSNLPSAAVTGHSMETRSRIQHPELLKRPSQKSKKVTKPTSEPKHNLKFKNNRYQILTVVALIKGRDCPIAIGIIKSTDFEIIQQFLNFLKLKIPLNPSTILTSQNEVIQQSIQDIWPESTMKVMYFYYAQSVLENLQKNFTEISKNIFEISSLKMILSMPLIPTNYVIPGWEALRKWMNEKNVDLDGLCDDVYSKWLADNAERISIFNGLTHSINNHTQVFQSELINSFEAVPMKSDKLIDKISRQATKNFIKFTKTNESSANKIQKLQKTVKIATKSWISSPFHLRRPIQFLQQVSHCIDDGMINFVMNFDGNCCEDKKMEPPPLIFFEKEGTCGVKKGDVGKKKENLLSSEPPPLVPIRR